MKKILISLAVIYINIFSQTHYLEGYIYEEGTRIPLAAANIIITEPANSTINGIASDNKGRFRIEELEEGKYILKISFVGYKSYIDTLDIHHSIDLGNIYLTPSEVLMDDVEVVEKAIPVVMNADTTEYNADAFTTHKNATAEDLLSKMPGIIVDDGSVETQGESVTKIVVDGKEFFSNDPAAVLKNIPAEMVEKFQVYDKKSEQAEFTGFDDGNTTKTINIVTRREFRQGVFGKLSGGYGSDERYLGGGNLNIFNNARRITLLGQLNNINSQNFSSEDILGVMSSGRDNRGGGRGSGDAGGGSSSGGLISSQSGLAEVKSAGANYNDEIGKRIKLGGNYFYNNTDNNTEAYVDRDYLLTSTNQNYLEESISNSKNINHRFSFRMNYNIDSSNSILFTPSITSQDNESDNMSSGKTYTDSGLLNTSVSESGSDQSAINTSSSLLFRHKFKTRRRTFSMNLEGGYNNNTGNKNQYTENTYYDNETESDTINQITNIDNDGYSGAFNIFYTEPAGKNGIFIFNPYYSYSNDENNQKIFDLTENNSLDTSLSNVYSKVYQTQRYRIGYTLNIRKSLMFAADISYNIADLDGKQTFPYTLDIDKKFYSFLPSLNFNYNISRNRRFSFRYDTQNNAPSINQLQNVLDNSNSLQLYIGNPDLEQTYSHSFNVSFFNSRPSRSTSLFLRLNGTVTKNYIANNTIIAENDTTVFDGIELNQGVQITRPVNLSGYYSINSFVSYGLPVDFIKSNLNLNANAKYTNNPSISNNVKNYSRSSNFELGFNLSSNVSENLDFMLSSRTGYNSVNNTIKEENDKSYLNQNTKLDFYWDVWQGFVFQSNFQYSYEGGLSDDYDPNSYTWNLSIGKTLFNNERGEIKISVYDVLNQSSNIQRNITDTYTEDRQTNIIGQFFLVSFVYNLRTFY